MTPFEYVCEFGRAILNHSPDSSYIEASAGINFGAAAFRSIFERVRSSYLIHAKSIPNEFTLSKDALIKVGGHIAEQLTILDKKGDKLIFYYQVLALQLGLLCLALLYMGWNPWWAAFLPCPLLIFAWRFSRCAKNIIAELRRDVKGLCSINYFKDTVAAALSKGINPGGNATAAANGSNSALATEPPPTLQGPPQPSASLERPLAKPAPTTNTGSRPPKSPSNGKKRKNGS